VIFEEHARVSKAWREARRRGDPEALKYEKELMDSIASREHWNAGEWFEMEKKWYDERASHRWDCRAVSEMPRKKKPDFEFPPEIRRLIGLLLSHVRRRVGGN
jgi:hypothetical protein